MPAAALVVAGFVLVLVAEVFTLVTNVVAGVEAEVAGTEVAGAEPAPHVNGRGPGIG